MNKTQLIEAISRKTGIAKADAEKCLNAFCEIVVDSCSRGEAVGITGFGSFDVREHKARKGRNLRTGEIIQIPARRVPAFTPGKTLKEAAAKS